MMIMFTSCSSSLLLDKLRQQRAIAFVPELSSTDQVAFNKGSPFRLTCAFLSNFDKLNVFWFHNGTLIQSFVSAVCLSTFEIADQFISIILLFFSLSQKKKTIQSKAPILYQPSSQPSNLNKHISI